MIIKFIIAPYRPEYTPKVSALSKSLLAEDVSVISLHGVIFTGAYGDQTNQADKELGMKTANNIVTLISKLGIAQLYVMLDDNGLMDADVELQLNLWKQHNDSVLFVDGDGNPV